MTAVSSTAPDAHLPEGESEHPPERLYWIVAAVLAVVTALEVWLSYIDLGNGTPNAVLLLIGMVIKFVLVGGFFMHLKFDKKVLRRLFVGGLVLALFCYFVALMMFRKFPPANERQSEQEIHLVPSGIPQADPRP